jgi:hypothetical protein
LISDFVTHRADGRNKLFVISAPYGIAAIIPICSPLAITPPRESMGLNLGTSFASQEL